MGFEGRRGRCWRARVSVRLRKRVREVWRVFVKVWREEAAKGVEEGIGKRRGGEPEECEVENETIGEIGEDGEE